MKCSRNIKTSHTASTSRTRTSSPSILNFTFPVLMRLLVVLVVVPSFVQQQVYAAAAAQLQLPFVRFNTLPALLALLVSDVANWPILVQAQPEFRVIGSGICIDSQNRPYDYIAFQHNRNGATITSRDDCETLCVPCASEVSSSNPNRQFRGFTFATAETPTACACYFDNAAAFWNWNECENLDIGSGIVVSPTFWRSNRAGSGEIFSTNAGGTFASGYECSTVSVSDAPSESPSIPPSEFPSTAKASKAPKSSKTPKAASTSSLQAQEMKSEGGTPYSSSFSPLTMLGVCGTFAVISVTFVELF